MFQLVQNPQDDDIPPAPEEEIEMLMEEAAGHPLPGNPQDRTDALTKRIAYLKRMKRDFLERDDTSCLPSINRDLAEAEKQLAEWKLQHGSRN